MKKILGVALASVLALSVTAACSTSSKSEPAAGKEDANQPVTIRVLSSDDFAGFREEAIKEFNKKYPNIKVQLEHVAYDQLHDKELASFNAKGDASYDVVDTDEIWTAEYANAGFIQPVTARYTDEMKSGILPAALNITKLKGDYYGVPMFNDVLFFYYNEDMLKKAGFDHPPKTWDEFTAMSKTLQQKKIVEDAASTWGWSANEGLVCYFSQFLASHGGKFLDEKGNPVFNDAKGVQALQYMVDSMNKDGIVSKSSLNSNDRQILDAFKNGKTAFVSGWSFYWGELNGKDSKIKGKAKVGLVPSANGAPNSTVTGSMYLGISAQTQHADAAWKFIEFLGSKEIQKQQSLKAGALPIWKDLYNDEELNKNHGAMKEMVKQLENTTSRPSLESYSEFSKDLQIRLQEALTGKTPVKTALDQAVAKAKELNQQ
ncbi:extracellular solute-binding protein [Aneurinibacillus tyrosinisolvens]|uniref:extracellular solute-binding protein n=1 Tax=Aneurinibacillus tyrosinisolvens TaxID=1443435 RepID=UPI00063F1F7D|nr:extracellular solute-binding protein [Aneurinibacillus tyrosinisolvens]